MATIVNERDKILQAAAVRIITIVIPGNAIPEALVGISLKTSTPFFKTDKDDNTDPASITFTLSRIYVTAAASWSVIAGSATLTGSGDTRTLTFGNMGSDLVTVRASVTEGGKTYTADATVTKVKDGIDGTVGTDGRRGTVHVYVIGSSWSNSVANNAILTHTGSAVKYAGDMVTIYNNAGFAETKYWDGILPTGSWVTGQIINGNLLVTGTLTADKIGAGSFSGRTFTGGTFTGGLFQTAFSGERVTLDGPNNGLIFYNSSGTQTGSLFGSGGSFFNTATPSNALTLSTTGSGAALHAVTNGASAPAIAVNTVGANPAIQAGAIASGSYAVLASGTSSGGGLRASASGVGNAIYATGPIQWGSYTWVQPSGTARRFLCDDGTWKVPLLPVSLTGSAGSLAGYITVYLADGTSQVKIPAYNL